MSTRNEAYHRARLAREKIRGDAYRAADQLSVDATTDADAKLRQAPATRSLSATVTDPEGLYTPQPAEAPIGRVVEIAYDGIKHQVRVDANGRVVAENPVADDGWSTRGTFVGDAEAFMAAKRAGVGLKAGPEEPPSAPPIPPPPVIRAEPPREPPLRGCSPISPRFWRGRKASFDEPNGLRFFTDFAVKKWPLRGSLSRPA